MATAQGIPKAPSRTLFFPIDSTFVFPVGIYLSIRYGVSAHKWPLRQSMYSSDTQPICNQYEKFNSLRKPLAVTHSIQFIQRHL